MLKLISFSSIIYCYCNTKEWFQLQLNIIGKLFFEIELNWSMFKFNIKSQTDVRVSFPKLTNRSPNYRWTLDNEYLIYPEWCYLIQLDISKNQLQFNNNKRTRSRSLDIQSVGFGGLSSWVTHCIQLDPAIYINSEWENLWIDFNCWRTNWKKAIKEFLPSNQNTESKKLIVVQTIKEFNCGKAPCFRG